MHHSTEQTLLSEAFRGTDDSAPARGRYFASVRALPGYRLEVVMQTGALIHCPFGPYLSIARLNKLRDEDWFASASTDGIHLIFCKAGEAPVVISAQEFLDLVLIGWTRDSRSP